MTWKKFLGAILIGAFIFGVPATNFDTPLTKTVSAMSAKDYEKVEENYKRCLTAYRIAKSQYSEARRRGASGAELRRYRVMYEAARRDYEMARREYERYRSTYRRYER